MRESEYTRDFDSSGQIIDVPLDLSSQVASSLIEVVAPTGEHEMTDYINFAEELDDGEAQALAIAKNRNFTLLTDDKKAINIAARMDVGVTTITTAMVVRQWQEQANVTDEELRKVLARIEQLARFSPRRGTPDWIWWNSKR